MKSPKISPPKDEYFNSINSIFIIFKNTILLIFQYIYFLLLSIRSIYFQPMKLQVCKPYTNMYIGLFYKRESLEYNPCNYIFTFNIYRMHFHANKHLSAWIYICIEFHCMLIPKFILSLKILDFKNSFQHLIIYKCYKGLILLNCGAG